MLEREKEKMSGFSFSDSPKLTRVEITTSTRMKTRYTHSRIKRLINSVYDYLEIQQWNSPMIAIFFISLSLSLFQLLVISLSQSKGDERFFSLEIFLSVAINVANRNRATFHILISAKLLLFRFYVLYWSIFCSRSIFEKIVYIYINNSKSTIDFLYKLSLQVCQVEFIIRSNLLSSFLDCPLIHTADGQWGKKLYVYSFVESNIHSCYVLRYLYIIIIQLNPIYLRKLLRLYELNKRIN